MLYLLYRFAYYLATHLPVDTAYRVGYAISDMQYNLSRTERKAVISNLRRVLNEGPVVDEAKLDRLARAVYRNFARYLVDFLRSSQLMTKEYVDTHVKVEGMQHLKESIARGKGVILLSAHLGNWELGGMAIAALGYPVHAVALTHQNKRINDLFQNTRLNGKVIPIEPGLSLRRCYQVLKNNELLGLVGDRDFFKSGFYATFFGEKALMPKGPAAFSHRLGAPIVPTFMVWDDDDKYRLIFEEPIFPSAEAKEDLALSQIAARYLAVMERYIKRYPTQWSIFRDIWSTHEKHLCPDTIV